METKRDGPPDDPPATLYLSHEPLTRPYREATQAVKPHHTTKVGTNPCSTENAPRPLGRGMTDDTFAQQLLGWLVQIDAVPSSPCRLPCPDSSTLPSSATGPPARKKGMKGRLSMISRQLNFLTIACLRSSSSSSKFPSKLPFPSFKIFRVFSSFPNQPISLRISLPSAEANCPSNWLGPHQSSLSMSTSFPN